MKQDLFSLYQIAEKLMLWIGKVVVNGCGRTESSNLRKQGFKGLYFLTLECTDWSGTWWNGFVHIHYPYGVGPDRASPACSRKSRCIALSLILLTSNTR